ncbi:TonB family protein [Anaeromyxobacter diazotrophicus]|uniref:TonB C-terminal domain-containing protein n=1 Tax=Anaeromyxobacter diazotrophicus TaxID=2590199 RepID=A0A7I9VNN0_9BACT|nr:TonB family protein [Anaeromyxobacter diazotrophicus]GEJ58013.1 hypothetical protein AMYX_27540 [Anaeromyxobacter diazotrophicus]
MSYLGPSLRRRRRRQRPGLRLAAALLVSLLVNAAGLLLVRTTSVMVPSREAGGPARSVELAPLSSAQWEANRRPASGAAAPRPSTPLTLAPAPPPAPPPPRSAPGQVVDVAPSKNATPPKDSRFVAEHDSTVEKETRSRHAAAGFKNTLPKPSQPNPAAPPPPEARQQARAEEGGSRAGARATARPSSGAGSGKPTLPDQPARQQLALRLDPRGGLQLRAPKPGVRGNGSAFSPGAQPPGGAPAPGEGGRGGEGQGRGEGKGLQLRPSASNYDQLAGGPAPDKLDGVEEGEGTYLNTREWKYASYFNRIKQAVATQWQPSESLRLRDPTGERFAYKDRVTVVSVTLDAAGSLKGLQVQRSSGVDFLDATALEAFRKAQPFVNPPRGLANDRGEIAFVFGFYLEVGSGLHIFRGPAGP